MQYNGSANCQDCYAGSPQQSACGRCANTLSGCSGTALRVLGVRAQGLRFAAVLWGGVSDKCRFGLDCPVLEFTEVMARGRRGFTPAALGPSDLATLVYTSGTTGKPKVPPSALVCLRSSALGSCALASSQITFYSDHPDHARHHRQTRFFLAFGAGHGCLVSWTRANATATMCGS